MIHRYWTDPIGFDYRRFVIAEDGIIKVEKYLFNNAIANQPSREAVLALMAAIEEQAEEEYGCSLNSPR